MERMGDILARSARLRARRERLSAAQTAQPPQPAEPRPAEPKPAPTRPRATTTRATRPAAPARSAQPSAPAAPPAAPAAAPDVAHRALPPTDTLDTERILELPAQRVARATAPLVYAGAAMSAEPPAHSESARRSGARPQPAPPALPALPPSPPQRAHGRPAIADSRRMSAGSSGMLSLGEAAKGYASALRPDARDDSAGAASRAAPGAASAGRASAPRTTARAASVRSAGAAPDVCPHCHGAGYVRADVPVGDPAFGQAIACACKERQLEERRLADLRGMSSLDAFRAKTFATFDTTLPGVREALEVAQRYADDPLGWLVLSGGYGVGKTHLAAAIAHECVARGQSVFFSIVPDLLDHLRAAFAPTSEITYDKLFDDVREAGVLVLDDLGAENATAWATEKLFQIINYRYNFQMPTVITTNNRLLSHMDERIRSRLSDRSFVRNVAIDSADYRERHAGRPRQTAQRQGQQPGAPRGARNAYQR